MIWTDSGRTLAQRFLGPAVVAALAACAHAPPENFAPDPGLVAQIRDIEIAATPSQICPGAAVQATYQAVLGDGTRVPFSRTYDKKNPPRLHVVFLDFTSPEATANGDGNWVTSANALVTATTGYRLTATFKVKPAIHHTTTLPPDYSCTPHAFAFGGDQGQPTQAGANGPDVTVRLGFGRSPFYDKVLVASVQAGEAAPFYLLYDGRAIPPADFIAIESRGGRGGQGAQGTRGGDGVPGASGCPAQAGGPGGDGGNGGSGAPGGRGGRITVVVPDDQPLLAGLVAARTPGGHGGPGGPGGPGGAGGKGGPGAIGANGTRCLDASDGSPGRKGMDGPVGSEGPRGPQHDIVTAPARDVFGAELPPELQPLLQAGRH